MPDPSLQSDDAFRERLARNMEEQADVLARLAKKGDPIPMPDQPGVSDGCGVALIRVLDSWFRLHDDFGCEHPGDRYRAFPEAEAVALVEGEHALRVWVDERGRDNTPPLIVRILDRLDEARSPA